MLDKFAKNVEYDGEIYKLLSAGFPSYPRNFSRDSFMSMFLDMNSEYLLEQIKFSAKLQGSKYDLHSAEEPGKIHHEFPGVELRDRNTQYNACDTTALFLIAIEKYVDATGKQNIVEEFKENITKSLQYMMEHVDENYLFAEKCNRDGDKCFSLWVTYWKDSVLLNSAINYHDYPVFYFLTHCIFIRGFRAANQLLQTDEYTQQIDSMIRALHKLFDTNNTFPVYIDKDDVFTTENSDFLHALYYLEPGDLTQKELEWIANQSICLETDYGYRTNNPKYCDLNEPYHSCTLWPFEQGFIYLGGKKFGLEDVCRITARLYDKFKDLNNYPEIIDFNYQNPETGGNSQQLWTYSCMEFFKKELNKN